MKVRLRPLHRRLLCLLAEFGSFLATPLSAGTSAKDAVTEVLIRAAHQFSEAWHPPGCMVSCAELRASLAGSPVVQQMVDLRAQAQAAIRRKLDDARQSGELPQTANTADLAAYFAMVIQGMAVQAVDGASESTLQRLAQLSMNAWPE